METLKKITEIIHQHIDRRIDIDASTLLSDDAGIGSFDQLMIINAIEDEYHMEFTSNDFERFKTVGDIAKVLEEKYLVK